jgi:DNA-binding HxlR family transcriptional regulator
MQHGYNADCPMRQLLNRLGDKWTALAIAVLANGPRRFGELRRELGGVSQKVLTEVVRSLERDGFFSRHVLATAPLQVEYRLTPLGSSLAALLLQLRAWADAHMSEVRGWRTAYDAARSVELEGALPGRGPLGDKELP